METLYRLYRIIFGKTIRAKIPTEEKEQIKDLLNDMINQTEAGTAKIDEQIAELTEINRIIDKAEERAFKRDTAKKIDDAEGGLLPPVGDSSALTSMLKQLADKTGLTPVQIRRSIVDNINAGYAPNDPKRMRLDDSESLERYLQTKLQYGDEQDLIDDVIEGLYSSATDTILGSKEATTKIPPVPPGLKRFFDEDGDFIDDAAKKEFEEKILVPPMQPKKGGLEEMLDDELKKINQEKQDLRRAEELMTDINNFGKTYDEIMQMVQDEKVVPIKPKKKATGGRVQLKDGGGLLKDLSIQDYMRLAGFKDFVSPATATPTLKRVTKDPGLPQLANVTQADFSKFEDEYNQLLEKRRLFNEATKPKRPGLRRPGSFKPFNNPKFSEIMSKEEDERLRLLQNTFISPFGDDKMEGGPIAPFGLTEDGRPILNPSINRIGLKDGGGPKLSRRRLLQLMSAGIGSLMMPRGAKKVADAMAPAVKKIMPAPGMPDWFPLLAQQIKTKGKKVREPDYADFTSGGDTTVRYELKDKRLAGDKIFLEEDMQTGAVSIYGRGDDYQQVSMDYFPGPRTVDKQGRIREAEPNFEMMEFAKGEIQDVENFGGIDEMRGDLGSWIKLSGVDKTAKKQLEEVKKLFKEETKDPNIEPDEFAEGGGVGSLFKRKA